MVYAAITHHATHYIMDDKLWRSQMAEEIATQMNVQQDAAEGRTTKQINLISLLLSSI